jgi:uncharacterized surface protein with fasciclin (FAS1) repeats
VNLAFGKLSPGGSFEDLIKDGNKIRLSDIITYHVIAGKKMLRDFTNGQKIKTINGKDVAITVKDGEVCINGAKFFQRTGRDQMGVIHSVDTVNIPEE